MARRPLTSGTVCRLRDSLMIIVAEPVPFGHHWFLVYIEKEQKKMFKKSFSRGLLSLIFFLPKDPDSNVSQRGLYSGSRSVI